MAIDGEPGGELKSRNVAESLRILAANAGLVPAGTSGAEGSVGDCCVDAEGPGEDCELLILMRLIAALLTGGNGKWVGGDGKEPSEATEFTVSLLSLVSLPSAPVAAAEVLGWGVVDLGGEK